MDREAFDGTIRTFKHRTPFRPFTVSLVSGERLEVDHPDALAVRDGLALFIGPGRIPSVFDHEGVARVVVGSGESGDGVTDRRQGLVEER